MFFAGKEFLNIIFVKQLHFSFLRLLNLKEKYIMKRGITILILTVVTAGSFTACQKDGIAPDTPLKDTLPVTNNTTLSYGDTIFYLQPLGSPKNIVSPKPLNKQGTFYAFPEGIELDSITGKINLEESEMGLRYKIMFVPKGTSDTIKVKIVLSGINFYDKIYRLSQGDSIAHSIYNASGVPFTPGQFGAGNSTVFDVGGGCNSQGCAVSITNGKINLAKSIRDGALPKINDFQKEFPYFYQMDDASGKTLNKLKVKLYFYNTVADIPQYLWDILLIDHAGIIVPPGANRPATNSDIISPASEITTGTLGTLDNTGITNRAKPRPPCIVVILN